MKYLYKSILLITLFLAATPSASAQSPQCGASLGFVWSSVTNQCVQEICPADTVGRDVREQCLCPKGTTPVIRSGLVESCRTIPAARPEPKVAEPALSTAATTAAPFLLATSSTIAMLSTGSTTATITPRSPGIRWPVAAPTTVTLFFIIALGIGYWLYAHPAKK